MKLKKIILSILVCMLIPVLLSAEDENPKIAVMDLEGKNLSQDEADAVTDFLRTDLVNTKSFTVIERDRIKDVLKEQELSISGVTKESGEAAKVGELLNVKFIMVGTLSKLGEKYFLNIRVVDVETGKVTLAKRGSSKKLEDLTEVSKSIAYQLAGKKYKPKKDITIEDEEEEFKYPPVGIDFQYGIPLSYGISGIRSTDIKEETTVATSSNNEWFQRDDWNSKAALSDIRMGIYVSKLYIGYMQKIAKIAKGREFESTTTTTINDEEKTFSTQKGTSQSDYIITMKDIMLGYRGWTKGEIDPKIAYFSWRTVSKKPGNSNEEDKYAGPCIGFLNKWAIGIENIPLDILANFGLYGSYLIYDKPSGFEGDLFAISAGAEIGAGVQWRRIGLYATANYIFDLLYEKYKHDTSITVGTTTTETKTDISNFVFMKGFEVRIGYTFDMQALLH